MVSAALAELAKLMRRLFQVLVRSILWMAVIVLAGCSGAAQTASISKATPITTPDITPAVVERKSPAPTKEPTLMVEEKRTLANVISVQVTGNAGDYQFSVGISSPDTGCEQYADWWEVLSEQGELLYRRVLLHSHVDEQPFVRSGGSVEIAADTIVWVRAHMNPGGYGGLAYHGSVQDGFTQVELDPDFVRELEFEPPLPDGCAF